MTANEVLRYIQLASRKSFVICHSGNDWKPEYEEELQQINHDNKNALARAATPTGARNLETSKSQGYRCSISFLLAPSKNFMED